MQQKKILIHVITTGKKKTPSVKTTMQPQSQHVCVYAVTKSVQVYLVFHS